MHPVLTAPALCVVGHTVPGRHTSDQCETDCTGCLPAAALPGLQVCGWHERRVLDALRDLPGLWADLADPRRSRPTSAGSSSDTGSPMLISDDARTARSAIRMLLASWCLILRDDYGLREPADTVRAMARHIAVQAHRLLGSEHADQLCADLLGHQTDDGMQYEGAAPRARRLANPSPPRQRIRCGCGQWVTLVTDHDEYMTCRHCGTEAVLKWWIKQAPAPDRPLTLRELVDWLLIHHGHAVTISQLRQWAQRDTITPTAALITSRANLYDPTTVAIVAGHRLARRRVLTAS